MAEKGVKYVAYTKIEKQDFTIYINEGGPIISCSDVPVIEQDGFIFKDLERRGKLLPYEDWRLDYKTRAEDLANRLTLEEMIGLWIWQQNLDGCVPWILLDRIRN